MVKRNWLLFIFCLTMLVLGCRYVISISAKEYTTGWEVPGGFINVGMAYDTEENVLWVGEYCPGLNGKVHKIRKDGTNLTTFEVPDSGNLQGVAHDSKNGTLWITIGQQTQNNVKQISKTGKVISAFTLDSNLGAGIAYNPERNTLYISPYEPRNTIYEVSKTGEVLKSIPINKSFGNAKDGYYADGIACDQDGTLWITQNGRESIYHVDLTGNILKTVDNPGVYEAEGITIDKTDNTIWYSSDDGFHQKTDHGNRIYHLPQ